MKVKFVPQNIELEIEPNQSVLDLAQKNGVFIKSVCNGLPSCAECRVKVVEGEHNVIPPFSKELNLIGTGHYIDRRRLACQMQCFGDITVDLSEQLEKQASGPRRPQGSKKSTEEKSFAVTGNLIEQEHNVLEESAKDDYIEANERSSNASASGSQPQSKKSASGDFKKNKGQQAQGGSAKRQNKKGNRNRNRNNKRRPKATDSKNK